MAEKKKTLIEEEKKEEKRLGNPPYLKHIPSGRIYPYHPITAQRGDVIPWWKKPEVKK